MEPLGKGTLSEIRREAAAWLVEMDGKPEHWNRRQFAVWLQSSPRHMEEYLFMSVMWRALDDVDLSKIDIGRQSTESLNVVDWPKGGPSTAPMHGSRRVKRLRWAAGIAALGIAFLSVTWLWSVRDTRVFTTDIGEQRVVRLADRSVVHLNTNSRVKIQFTDNAREVHLLRGEALFTVEHDSDRPFRVHTDGVNVLQAVGTQFNVRRAAETLVSVIEGRVAVVPKTPPEISSAGRAARDTPLDVSAAKQPVPRQDAETLNLPSAHTGNAGEGPRALTMLAAGEQARIAADGHIEMETIEDLASATAWRQRLLVFSHTPLSEVVAEVARYNVTPRLQVEDDELGARQVNGVFAADNPEALVAFLERDPDVSVTRNGDVIVIKTQRQ